MNIKQYLNQYHAWLDRPESPDVSGGQISRGFRIFMIFWFLLWSVLPCLCIDNVFIDVSENIAWGHNFQWGYDKNPYFGAWFSQFFFRICESEYLFYFLSQLFVLAAVVSVWILGKRIFHSERYAAAAVMLTLTIPFFSQSACEFNDDVMELGLWGLLFLFFHLAIKKKQVRYWLLTGLTAGLAFMTKYLAVIIFIPLLFAMFATKEGRASAKTIGPYLGLLIVLVLTLPNLFWLIRHDFITIQYAFSRSETATATLADYLWNPVKFVLEFSERLLIPVIAAILFFKRGTALVSDPFDRYFIISIFFGPVLLSFLFSMVSGGEIIGSWTTPYYVPAGLAIVMLMRPEMQPRRLKLLFSALLIFTFFEIFAFGFEYLYKRPYLKSGVTYTAYPGKETAEYVEKEWKARVGNIPVPYVVGTRKGTCNMVFYGKDHPVAFFDSNTALSPWIDPADILKKGAVFIWENKTPEYLKEYPDTLVMLKPLKTPRAAKAWFRKSAGNPPEATIHAAILPPGK